VRNIVSQQFKCGNCADWIGYGLQKVGLIDDISMLPVIPPWTSPPSSSTNVGGVSF
jgi:hypothetical protein